jgi:hypothetical protein
MSRLLARLDELIESCTECSTTDVDLRNFLEGALIARAGRAEGARDRSVFWWRFPISSRLVGSSLKIIDCLFGEECSGFFVATGNFRVALEPEAKKGVGFSSS